MINRKALKEIANRFDENKIIWGLGGSCMMFLQGIDVDPRDIDLIVIPQDFALALRLLNESGTFEVHSPSGIFASEHFAQGTLMDSPVDLIAGFRIIADGQIIAYPFDDDRIIPVIFDRMLIPCCLLEDWIPLYDAMDKHDKADMIKRKCGRIRFDLD
ncbi:MAG: hypothetical protein WBL80_04825 [Erysipelotrichaceae bacterium]